MPTKEQERRWAKTSYERHREKILAHNREYYQKNKRRIQDQRNERRRWRLANDPQFYLKHTLRGRIHEAMKWVKASKAAPTAALVGCSYGELKKYLESKFQPGMTWLNKGKWHIDHIIPCAWFDLTDPEQQKTCFHYSNLQPMWAHQNHKKGTEYMGVKFVYKGRYDAHQ